MLTSITFSMIKTVRQLPLLALGLPAGTGRMVKKILSEINKFT